MRDVLGQAQTLIPHSGLKGAALKAWLRNIVSSTWLDLPSCAHYGIGDAVSTVPNSVNY